MFTHLALSSQGPGAQEGSRNTSLVLGTSRTEKVLGMKAPKMVLASRLVLGLWTPADLVGIPAPPGFSSQQIMALLGEFARQGFCFSPPFL